MKYESQFDFFGVSVPELWALLRLRLIGSTTFLERSEACQFEK